MTPRTFFCLIVILLAGMQFANGEPPATAPSTDLPGPVKLPAVAELPDPFLFQDGSRVKSRAEWPKRRAEIQKLILGYEYGRMPPAPGNVRATDETRTVDDKTGATHKKMVLAAGPNGDVRIRMNLTIPAGKGPFPAIVCGDLCWHSVAADVGAEILKRGYVLAEFDRTDVAADGKDRAKGIYPVYGSEYDCGALCAWAWGFHRVVDYLLTQPNVDPQKIVVTGHSRGGKAALVAGATDERVAITVPNGSGCGGAGSYRVNPPKTEDIKAITKNFPYWFNTRFPEFVGHVEQLPFDQHELKAMVAPRALLTTDATGDVWANAPGTQATYQAAKVVFEYLGAGDKIGLHYRAGAHDQNLEDWTALLDFADHVLAGKPVATQFDELPVPEQQKYFTWTAPKE